MSISKLSLRDLNFNMHNLNLSEFDHPANHILPNPCLKSRNFIDLNVIPDEDEEQTLAGEQDAHNNDAGKTKSNQEKTRESDKPWMCMHPVANILNCVDPMMGIQPVAKVTTKMPSSRELKRGPELTMVSNTLIERPGWLPKGWEIETRVQSSGATAGLVDRYYVEPVSGRRFRSKNEVLHFLETGSLRKRKLTPDADVMPSDSSGSHRQKKTDSCTKNSAALNFDFNNAPNEVCWVLTDSSKDSWALYVGDKMVPESSKREWTAAFTHLSQLEKDGGTLN